MSDLRNALDADLFARVERRLMIWDADCKRLMADLAAAHLENARLRGSKAA